MKIKSRVLIGVGVVFALHCAFYFISRTTQRMKFDDVSLEGTYTNPEHPLIGRYLDVNRQFPSSRLEFQEFLSSDTAFASERNLPIAETNGVLKYLISSDSWHVSFSPDEKWFIVYDEGPNFRNDSMSEFVTHKDLNFWNYYLKSADVLIFKQSIEFPYAKSDGALKPPSP